MRQLKITPSITSRDSRALEQYLNDISKIGMVTADEEVTLTRLIRNGDQAALHKLTGANLRFVVSVSKKFQNQGLSLNDLINEGNLGLIKAAQRFDESKGFKFISYAVWWIRQGMMQAIAEQSRLVRLPSNQISALSRLHRQASQLEQEFEREPSIEEIAAAMELSTDSVAGLISKSRRSLSLDANINDESENSLMDLLAAEGEATDELLMRESLSVALKDALKHLSERERGILMLFFGIGQEQPFTLEEIANRYQLTRERVRQLKDKALHQLRHYAGKRGLLKYL
ncbi:sigma-70 family RNA polymerase sigma factor [Mucilaginibacter auburnensis]|uniref:RNA polymerase primary sigma factor n=1 Tax=Mucilaginibacter auburnensis TaxID=1457233 RepID=A0A2H9VW00_9SPHI|nr:RNA polymerase sigma factor RpoD/SigA [Mucilaginibacter auburnensis]PJJ85006.1 RNA polymerase primary sigma factor [Mucilaginibacter auburnensis]